MFFPRWFGAAWFVRKEALQFITIAKQTRKHQAQEHYSRERQTIGVLGRNRRPMRVKALTYVLAILAPRIANSIAEGKSNDMVTCQPQQSYSEPPRSLLRPPRT